MKYSTTLLALAGLAIAEVPQELSHKKFLLAVQDLLQINNQFNILDAVFGLLGDAAAANGAGDVEDLDCLQQITADEAFTNALTLEDADARLEGQINALIFRALEKNTGQVGLESAICTQVAVNEAIAAITQHQDPAAENAAQINKDIVLALAIQIALLGGDPTLALLSGTFEPGELGDPTGAGNTCDDDDDNIGCIFTRNLIVADASIDEINAAVADAMGAGAPEANAAAAEDLPALAAGMNAGNVAAASVSVEVEADSEEEDAASVEASATVNVQTFAGDLGGAAPAVQSSDAERPFDVQGSTFLNAGAALQRSCAIQHNACANAANSGQLDGGVQACDEQEDQCLAAANLRKRQTGTVNVQTFAGALGGPPPAVQSSDAERPFDVQGSTFLNIGAAIQRSCAVQHNACANAANSGQIDADVQACGQQEDACLAAANLKIKRGKIIKLRQLGAVDLGSCSDPSIQFAEGLDGRKEASFAPVNKGDFSHGSALNINIISTFICDRLGSSCAAPDETVALCEQGVDAAQGLEGQDAADAFNAALSA